LYEKLTNNTNIMKDFLLCSEEIYQHFPLWEQGFSWILPAIILAIIWGQLDKRRNENLSLDPSNSVFLLKDNDPQ
ncbi:MAG: hypothetical protein Q4P28_06265, partial [Tissierellia bacterium]|nr:hypothetical protein [Tissierellia bacterium]